MSSLLSVWFVLQHPPTPFPTGTRIGAGHSPGTWLPPADTSYHQPVGGISPPSQTPTAASKIQLSAELAESYFHRKNTQVLPEIRAVIGTAWPERSRQLSPWSTSRNAGKKLHYISYLGLRQHGWRLQKLKIPGKLMLYICLRWWPAWTAMGFGPWPVWSTLFLAEQLSLTVICEVTSQFHSVILMAALFSCEISMLTRVAVEVIYCLASATRHTHHFAVKGAHVVSISLMSCSPPHPLGQGQAQGQLHFFPL